MTVAHAHDPRGPVSAILDRLHKVKRSGDGWVARCPAHQDREPSLSITEGRDGRVLLKCHAGCAVTAITQALGITEADLFEPREELREVAVYKYTDELGTHLYDVVRFHPKTFRQRRPNGVWGLGDTRRVLYRLTDLANAIAAGNTVYVVEGEKDADAIAKTGATATCNPMGAGKWRTEYTQQLAGAAQIIIVADNDDPGVQHATQVAAQLEQAGIPHRIVVPASGKDAADHLHAGHTLDELVPRIPPADTPASPILVETWRQFADKASEEVPCIVEGLWPEGAIGFIASPPKKGKTWLALGLALSVATGHDYLTMFPVARPRPVLYIALEGHRAALTHRLAAMARGMGIDPDQEIPNLHIAYKPRGINMADPAWAEHILQAVNTIDAQLVLVDVLRAATVMKENSADDFGAMITNLSPVLDGVRSLALLHHFTKLNESTKDRDPGERMSGSGAMYGALDVGIYITGSENGARRLRLAFETRDIASPDGLGIELSGTGSGKNGGFNQRDKAWWSSTEAPDEDDVDVPAETIRDWILENGGTVTRSQIKTALEISDKTIKRREIRLAQLGVKLTERSGKSTLYEYTEPTPDTPDTPRTRDGVHPGQDTLDTCPGSAVSGVNPSIQAKTDPGQDTPDTNPVSGVEKRPEQGKQTPDTPDSSTRRDLPVSGVSPETNHRAPDNDIPF